MMKVIIQKKTQKYIYTDTVPQTYYIKYYINIYILHIKSPSCVLGKKLIPDTTNLLKRLQAHNTADSYYCSGICSDGHSEFSQVYTSGTIIYLLFIFQDALTETRHCCPSDYVICTYQKRTPSKHL